MNDLMDKIVALCKRRGFIYPGSEIYGGLAGTWDYGPLGVELKRNIKNEWWKDFVQKREDMVGLDSQILLHPTTWVASGHVGGFNDPQVDCRKCKSRVLVLITSNQNGISSLGLLTDLSSEEVVKFSQSKPVSTDDVLDLYQTIQTDENTLFNLV